MIVTDAELEEHRRDAEEEMTSRCRVLREGLPVKNAQRIEVAGWAVVHPDLLFKLAGSNAGGSGYRTIKVGGGPEIQVAVRIGKVPALTTNLRDGDLIDVTAGENAGLVLKIIEATGQDRASARRMPLYEVSRPKEWD